MDSVLADTLKANLKTAKTPEAKMDAMVLSQIAVVDCQQKTGARVKRQGKWIITLAVIVGIALVYGSEFTVRLISFWRGN